MVWPINQALVTKFEEEEEATCNLFVAMGYEAGLLIAEAYTALGDKWCKRKSFKSFILDAKLKGPRAGHHFNAEYQCSFADHHLRKVEKSKNELRTKVVETLDAENSLDILKSLYEQPSSGWDNLYLCV